MVVQKIKWDCIDKVRKEILKSNWESNIERFVISYKAKMKILTNNKIAWSILLSKFWVLSEYLNLNISFLRCCSIDEHLLSNIESPELGGFTYFELHGIFFIKLLLFKTTYPASFLVKKSFLYNHTRYKR